MRSRHMIKASWCVVYIILFVYAEDTIVNLLELFIFELVSMVTNMTVTNMTNHAKFGHKISFKQKEDFLIAAN